MGIEISSVQRAGMEIARTEREGMELKKHSCKPPRSRHCDRCAVESANHLYKKALCMAHGRELLRSISDTNITSSLSIK